MNEGFISLVLAVFLILINSDTGDLVACTATLLRMRALLPPTVSGSTTMMAVGPVPPSQPTTKPKPPFSDDATQWPK